MGFQSTNIGNSQIYVEVKKRLKNQTFHPRFSKNIDIRAWAVVFPAHGPEMKLDNLNEVLNNEFTTTWIISR